MLVYSDPLRVSQLYVFTVCLALALSLKYRLDLSMSRVPRYTSNYFHTTLSKPSRAEGSLQSFLIIFVIISMIDLSLELMESHMTIIICNKESLQVERAWKEHAGKEREI